MYKSGTVAVIGRANAGKSTLVNVLVGEKIAIVSPKPQTTRDRIRGILTTRDYQIVFEDTPGLYKAGTLLSRRMQRAAMQAAKDVDVILFVVDCHEGVGETDFDNIRKFASLGVPTIVAFTKTDIMPKERLFDVMAQAGEIEGVRIIPVSARRGRNIKKLVSEIVSLLPESPPIYGDDVVSDRSERFMVGEIMREKILLLCDKEIPHGVAVVVNEFELSGDRYEIGVDIVCEKENHKPIIIGKQGAMLKKINTFARESMEKFLGKKVFLTTFVKVREGWRDDPGRLRDFGYSTENFE